MKGQRVAVVGVGYSTVARNSGLSLEALSAQASVAAMADAGLKPSDIDGLVTHCFPHQLVFSTQMADILGIPDLGFYSGSFDGAAYAVAAMHGAAAVASGSCHTCLTIRPVHRLGASGSTRTMDPSEVSGPQQFLAPFGELTAAQWAAMYMMRHMAEFGTTMEQFGHFAIAQREFATKNPDAFFRDPLTMDDYLSSRMVADPLHILDCDYPVDSASALIFTTEERARDLIHKPVFIESWAAGTTPIMEFNLLDNMPVSSPWNAAKRMWSQTDLTVNDVDIAGLYDGFTFIAMQWLEALGFCGLGESGPFVEAGNTRVGGRIPTNTDGGACNVGRRHGANFYIEVTRQLRGECGDRQIPGAEVGVVSNSVGGFAGCALLTV
ncbi:MAG: thiolase family protein [Acidimicrobiia bacterium]